MPAPQTSSSRTARPLWPVMAVYGGLFAVTFAFVLRINDGVFTYTMDDAYIHLAMARNLVTDGTYGVVAGVNEPASSSPLWTFGLAPFSYAPALARFVPLVVNLAAGAWILFRLTSFPATRRLASRPLGWLAVLLLPVTLGLVPLAFTGMEHLLHAVITIELLLLLRTYLTRPAGASISMRWWVGVAALAALGMVLRLETALLVVGLGLAAVWGDRGVEPWTRRLRFGLAAGLGAGGGLVLVVVVSTITGRHPLPNSVLAKAALADAGVLPDIDGMTQHLRFDLLVGGVLVLLLVGLLGAGTPRAVRAPALAVLITLGLHIAYVDYGLLARYRGYVLIAAVAASLLALDGSPLLERDVGRLELAGLLVLLCLPRLTYIPLTWEAAADVHANQEQMGRFLAEAYDGRPVAVNDIGMVAYQHEGPLVDLLGLGSSDVLDAMLEDERDRAYVADLFERRGVEVMVTYDELFEDYVPEDWVRVRRWCYDERIILVEECISFYAPPSGAGELDRRLAEFEPTLPDRVRVVGEEGVVGESSPS